MIDIVIKPNFKRSPETRREMRPCTSSRRSVRVHDRLEGRARGREAASRDAKGDGGVASCASV